jgi:hypothetical protein
VNPFRLAVIAAILIAATGCGYGTAEGSTGKACDINVSSPQVSIEMDTMT